MNIEDLKTPEERIEYLFDEIRTLRIQLELVQTTLQIIQMEVSPNTIMFGPSASNPPWRVGDYPEPFIQHIKKKEEPPNE